MSAPRTRASLGVSLALASAAGCGAISAPCASPTQVDVTVAMGREVSASARCLLVRTERRGRLVQARAIPLPPGPAMDASAAGERVISVALVPAEPADEPVTVVFAAFADERCDEARGGRIVDTSRVFVFSACVRVALGVSLDDECRGVTDCGFGRACVRGACRPTEVSPCEFGGDPTEGGACRPPTTAPPSRADAAATDAPTEDGALGDASEDVGPPTMMCPMGMQCAPGDTRACACTGTQTCGADCRWSACAGGGACAAGATQRCGNCSSGTRTCQMNCTWGACAGASGCAPGDTSSCGNCGSGTRECQSDCTWGGCRGASGCNPGSTQRCGNCSAGTQTCTSSCAWGGCVGGGACAAGSTGSCSVNQSCMCGGTPGGVQSCPGTRTCSGSCTWGSCTRAGGTCSSCRC